MGRYYDDRDDATGCLTSLLFSVIIIGVLIWLAAIVLYYIFIGIVVVSVIIGTIIALKNYIVSLKNSISIHRNDAAPLNWKLPEFTYKWKNVVFESIKGCWKSNIYTLKTSFQQGLYFRFFSIRRWFYWFVGISVTVFGLAVSCGIIYLHIVLLVASFLIIAVIVTLIALIMLTIALFDSVKMLVCNFFLIVKAQRKASRASTLVEYIKKWGYKGVKKMPQLLWRSSNKIFTTSISMFKNQKILSFSKWLGLGRSLLIYPINILIIPLIFIIQIIVQSILYLCFLFVK